MDDEVMLTQLLASHLTDTGYLVYTANSGGGYITKPFGLNELTARIAAHLRRENWMPQQAAP